MSDKEIPVVFVNTLEVQGTLNGVVNLLFATAKFIPDGAEVAVQKSHTLDLRFDLFCAQSVHDALTKILADNTKPTKMDS
jgi:hypothetical protein